MGLTSYMLTCYVVAIGIPRLGPPHWSWFQPVNSHPLEVGQGQPVLQTPPLPLQGTLVSQLVVAYSIILIV